MGTALQSPGFPSGRTSQQLPGSIAFPPWALGPSERAEPGPTAQPVSAEGGGCSGLSAPAGPRSVLSVDSRVSTNSRLRALPGSRALSLEPPVSSLFFSLPVHGSVLSLASSASSTYSSVRALTSLPLPTCTAGTWVGEGPSLGASVTRGPSGSAPCRPAPEAGERPVAEPAMLAWRGDRGVSRALEPDRVLVTPVRCPGLIRSFLLGLILPSVLGSSKLGQEGFVPINQFHFPAFPSRDFVSLSPGVGSGPVLPGARARRQVRPLGTSGPRFSVSSAGHRPGSLTPR